MSKLKIRFLDHVAIRVKDLEASAAWYNRVLDFRKFQFEEWGDFPIFMMSGKAGVALFPANLKDTLLDRFSRNVKIDHFAFNVDKENYEKAMKRFNDLGIPFDRQDHHFFESIYVEDPDGHKVELTTILVDEASFYLKDEEGEY